MPCLVCSRALLLDDMSWLLDVTLLQDTIDLLHRGEIMCCHEGRGSGSLPSWRPSSDNHNLCGETFPFAEGGQTRQDKKRHTKLTKTPKGAGRESPWFRRKMTLIDRSMYGSSSSHGRKSELRLVGGFLRIFPVCFQTPHHSARGVSFLKSNHFIIPARGRGWSAAMLLAMAPTAALTVFEPLSMQLVAQQSESLQQ